MESKELAEALVSDARYFNPMLRVPQEDVDAGLTKKYEAVLKKHKLTRDEFKDLFSKFDEAGELKKNLKNYYRIHSTAGRPFRAWCTDRSAN